MSVLLCSEINLTHLQSLLTRYGMEVKTVATSESIPGSFWKDTEAGLIGDTLYVRNNTPVHSALHETCHYICMDKSRREHLDTNAGGDYEEEDAVCYLQIILADTIPEMGHTRMMADMDTWGYSFRLGSAQAWFEQDAEDAERWLLNKQLIFPEHKPSWKLREK
jgi:hypothetical protein